MTASTPRARSASAEPAGCTTSGSAARTPASAGYDPARRAWTGLSAQFPSFSGEAGTAYQALNQYIGGRVNPKFDLRQAYRSAGLAQLGRWRDDINSAPQPSGVSGDVWMAVKSQLLGEIGNAVLVVDWYDNYLHSFTQDLFITELLDTSADRLKYATDSNAELEAEEMEMFEGVLEGLNVLEVVPGIGEAMVVVNSLLGGGVSFGLGVSGSESAQDEVELTYIELKNKLDHDFTDAIDGLSEARAEILGDYGLQSAVGGMIDSDVWEELVGNDRAAAIAGAQRNYALFVWQTITPEIWVADRVPVVTNVEGYTGPYPCSSPDAGDSVAADDPSDLFGECDWQDPQGEWWMLAWNHSAGGGFFQCDTTYDQDGPCRSAPGALRSQLFGATSESCKSAWDDDSCNLGVRLDDVFYGGSGWRDLPMRWCTLNRFGDGFECPRRR